MRRNRMSKLLVVCSVLLSATMALGQGKINSQWNCDAKPAVEHSINVGDQPGNTYGIGQGKCTSAKGAMGDVKEQEGTWTQFTDATGTTTPNHGVFIVTLASGDKVYYNYHGTSAMKDGKLGLEQSMDHLRWNRQDDRGEGRRRLQGERESGRVRHLGLQRHLRHGKVSRCSWEISRPLLERLFSLPVSIGKASISLQQVAVNRCGPG